MLVSDLLEMIPAETEQLVRETVERQRQPVRNALRTEIRLPLRWHSREGREERSAQCAVSVARIGLPKRLERHEIPQEYEAAARIALWLPSLEALHLSGADVRRMLTAIGPMLTEIVDVPATMRDLGNVEGTVQCLVRAARVREFDLVERILSVNEDVLGLYTYTVARPGFESPHANARIQFYWGAIGLCAAALGIRAESLTIVVIAHELAHAYTHLGFDRDGERWGDVAFANSEHALKEGLAQYYTARTLERLRVRVPEAVEAYEALLSKQPAAYRSHFPWLDGATPEAVGAALAAVRRRGAQSYDDFDRELEAMVSRIGTRDPAR